MMVDNALAEVLRRELEEYGHKRILVRNFSGSLEFADFLETLLNRVRVVVFDCSDTESFRSSIARFFSGDVFADRSTAFETAWRSFLTELSVFSGGSGLQAAAGLHSIKEEIKSFVLDSSRFSGLSDETQRKFFASFSGVFPTILCFFSYSGREGAPAAFLQSDTTTDFPPFVVFRSDDGGFEKADAVLKSGSISIARLENMLRISKLKVSPEEVFAATGGKLGLVELYIGIRSVTGITGSDVFAMLDHFMAESAGFTRYAEAAAVTGMQFLPEEVSLISGVSVDAALPVGRSINLWRGYLAACFQSDGARWHIMKKLDRERIEALLKKAAETAVEFRGNGSVAYRVAGDLIARVGNGLKTSEYYRNAAETASGELRRAELFQRAAGFAVDDVDRLLFDAALNLYRADLPSEALSVLDSMDGGHDSAYGLLRELCSDAGQVVAESIPFVDGAIPELVPELIESRRLNANGEHRKAENLLRKCAEGHSAGSVVCAVELAELLHRRGMVRDVVELLAHAGMKAREKGLLWLERRALFILLKSCTRAGRQDLMEVWLGRLTELTLMSGNRKKLAAVYNLYANFLLWQQQYSEALNMYSSALALLSGIPDSETTKIIILNNMGVAERRLFRSKDALHTLMSQVRLSLATGDLSKACIAYGNMARQFIDMWKPEEASDCLNTMTEFAQIGGVAEAAEPICFISSQIAFMRGDNELALSLIGQSVEMSRTAGKTRRLSVNLVKKGSMLLRLERYKEAAEILAEARDVSASTGSLLNTFVAEMKLTASKCFLGETPPAFLLALKHTGSPEDTHKGELMYYHWLLTGSRQSLCASTQLLSTGLRHGLQYFSYLFMLKKLAENMPESLAEAFPLLHNYPF